MGTIHIKVAVVLKFIDAVTEKNVDKEGIHIYIKQQNKFLWKSPDCVVILEQVGVQYLDISITGGIYQDLQLHLDLNSSKTIQNHTIWMNPSKNYPLIDDMSVIKGICNKDNLYMMRKISNYSCKLMENAKEGADCVRLWGLDGTVENRVLAFCEEDNIQLLTIIKQANDIEYGYFIKERLNQNFYKGKTYIYPVTKIIKDINNCFLMAYANVSQNGEQIMFICDENDNFCIDILEGQEYLINLK